ncbi:MAG: MogA/MoaB family molybdenum cofactor biosynthesis protein [Thermoplasmata archaeon]
MVREHHGEKNYNLRLKIVTVSSTRTIENDDSGKILEDHYAEKGYAVKREIVKDDPSQIYGALFGEFASFDFFIYNGGTGISRYDVTAASIRKVAEKEVRGFGELFRKKSEDQAGYFSYISDADLFIVFMKPVFCLPGSPSAQSIGISVIDEIINHIIYETGKE